MSIINLTDHFIKIIVMLIMTTPDTRRTGFKRKLTITESCVIFIIIFIIDISAVLFVIV